MEFIQTFGPFGVFFIMFALGLNRTFEKFVKVFIYKGHKKKFI